ncbi:MAG: DsbA family protein [Cypionkella sp.]|nr:DsbA family protein [Cypionkella sp.]
MRSILSAAVFVALTMPAQAQMSDAERETFRAEVRDYLLQNPEVIVEAMQILQSRQEEQAGAQDLALVQANEKMLFDDANSFVGGNLDGDVTIVEFMDYRCGYCRKAYTEIEELLKSDGNIRFVVKEFPILGDASVISSRFAIAVLQLHGDDAYKRAHDGLITLRGEPDDGTLTALAGELGLDAAPILARMGAAEVDAVIAANHALGDAMKITGTPTFVVGGQMLRGYLPLDAMQKVVADERG